MDDEQSIIPPMSINELIYESEWNDLPYPYNPPCPISLLLSRTEADRSDGAARLYAGKAGKSAQ